MDLNKKLSLRGFVTPFGGLSWSPEELSQETINNAKAFVSGYLIMYINLNYKINTSQLNYTDEIERINSFLKDLDVETNLNFLRKEIPVEVFHYHCDELNKQLWNKGGKIGHYFETAFHLFVNIQPQNKSEFNKLISEIDVPKKVYNNNKNTSVDILASIKDYYESIIFN